VNTLFIIRADGGLLSNNSLLLLILSAVFLLFLDASVEGNFLSVNPVDLKILNLLVNIK